MISFPPSPWRAEVQGNGTCRLLYIDSQGGMANDIWTFVREKDGGAVHVEIGQFNFSENPNHGHRGTRTLGRRRGINKTGAWGGVLRADPPAPY